VENDSLHFSVISKVNLKIRLNTTLK